MFTLGPYFSKNPAFPREIKPMGTVAERYEALASAPDNHARARLIADPSSAWTSATLT
jgi:hypothetical protein